MTDSPICPVCDRKVPVLERHHDHGPKPHRFPPTLICRDCNSLEGRISSQFLPSGPERYSLAPSEIRCVIKLDDRGRPICDDDAALALFVVLSELGPRVVLDQASLDRSAAIVMRSVLKARMQIAALDYARCGAMLHHLGGMIASGDQVVRCGEWREILGGDGDLPQVRA
jgi:hypothetical protein